MTTQAPVDTLQEARANVLAKLKEGVLCPCCGQDAKAQAREISKQAATIITLLHRAFPVGAVVSVEMFLSALQPKEFAAELLKSSGWRTLKYWGLLQEVEPTAEVLESIRKLKPKSRKPVLCQLTERGQQFTQLGGGVFKTVFTFDDKLIGWDSSVTVTVMDVVGSKTYAELTAVPVEAFGRVV